MFAPCVVGGDAAPILNNDFLRSLNASLSDHISLDVLEDKVKRSKRRLLNLLSKVGGWHSWSSLSSLNIIAVLFGSWIAEGYAMGVERLVVVSKGHAAPSVYSWLVEMGVIKESELEDFATPWSRLQSHLDALRLPGIVVYSTGSLGQGLSIANGIAIASKIDSIRREVAVLLGDGELDEGQVWEAIATASALKLDNVIAIIDRNMVQHTGFTEKVKPKEPLAAKFNSFGWYVLEVINNVKTIHSGLRTLSSINGKPKALIVRSNRRW